MKWGWTKAKELREVTERRQERADEAVAETDQIAQELDELESRFAASMERLRQLNKANNFAEKMRQVYS